MHPDNLLFNDVALKVLKERYLWKDEMGKIIETPKQMLERVAKFVAQGDEVLAEKFFTMMANLDFLPNSPTLMNAGREGKHCQLSACYVLDVPDTMEGIFEALKNQALIHKSGGGTGFNFSNLRYNGARVNSTNGKASGPVSFMELFDVATEKIMQGGMRRGANIAILNCDHPDILDFIDAKAIDGKLTNFNISVGITDAFMRKVLHDDPKAKLVWTHICRKARNTGDPGLVFLSTINRLNEEPCLGEITATNPCGEAPLYANEACNLGSINLANFVRDDGYVDRQRMWEVAGLATRFLDMVIDVNHYPLPAIEAAVKRTRKIGLGVMGWADMLIKMGIPYDSMKALELAKTLMKDIKFSAEAESHELACEKGRYPIQSTEKRPLRNAARTCIAPTGTISLLAGCSSGIEPLYAIRHERRAFSGSDGGEQRFTFVHPEYVKALNDPEDTRIARGVFKTALEISPSDHVAMQGTFQDYTDLAVSKTVNLPEHTTSDEISEIFIEAWGRSCKGITVYRDGSKRSQILTAIDKEVCPECGGELDFAEGCQICKACGWSPCGV